MFVEVLVVGIGSLTALVVFLVALGGAKNASHLAPLAESTVIAGLALAFAYALGILMDRGADSVLTSKRRRLRARYFASSAIYAEARRAISLNPDLVARADYARSRMRICRGWVFNSLLLFVAIDFAIMRFPLEGRILLISATTAIGALLVLGFYVAWRNITLTSYRKLALQAQPMVPHLFPQQAATGTRNESEGSAL
ncbi:hypothetical protein [Streptomyces anulatus]|uniref:hypothetical protein n=1 Tax=Streptomyces anulatus TaxID=1892 RepID=UPI00364E3C70